MNNVGKKPIKYEFEENGKKPIVLSKKRTIFTINRKKKNLLGFFIGFFIIFILILNLSIPSIEKVKNSVVLIEIYDINNEMIATGSGFSAYKNNWIVTNYHVIEGAHSINIVTDDKKSHNVNNIIIFNKDKDLAIIEVDTNLKPLKISKNSNLSAGQNVTAIGSPKQEINTVSQGIISNADDEGVIRFTAPISHGSSGGVLLDKRMNVIGVTSAGYDDAQNLNFAIKINELDKLYKFYKKNRKNELEWNASIENCYLMELQKSNYEIGLFDQCINEDNIIPKNINAFYKITSPISIISLSNQSTDLSIKDKYKVAELYDLLLDYEPSVDGIKVVDNAENWKPAQLIFELDIFSRYELAIYMVEMDKLNSNQYFDYICDLNLTVAEKAILLLSTAGYTTDDLNNDDIREMIKWLNEHQGINYDEMVGLMRNLGFTVDYETGDIWW